MGLNLGKAPGRRVLAKMSLWTPLLLLIAPTTAWVEIRPFSGLWCVYELAAFLRHGQAQQVKLFPVAMARILLIISGSQVPVTWI